MTKTIFAAIPAIAVSACMTMADAPRDDGWAAIGEATQVGPLTVTPVELVEDSRCPRGVQCVWAGRVVVRTLIDGAPPRFINLVADEDHPVSGGVIRIDRVEPEAIEGVEIQDEGYAFHFRFRPY